MMMVAASPVTKSLRKWFLTITFMPFVDRRLRQCCGATLRLYSSISFASGLVDPPTKPDAKDDDQAQNEKKTPFLCEKARARIFFSLHNFGRAGSRFRLARGPDKLPGPARRRLASARAKCASARSHSSASETSTARARRRPGAPTRPRTARAAPDPSRRATALLARARTR